MTPLPHASDCQQPLAFGSCRNRLQLLRDNGGIEREFWRRAAFVSLASLATAPLRFYERRRYHGAVRRHALETPPVFVIGHWRSGTTHLHNLLCQDTCFGYVTTYQAIAPDLLFVGERTLKPLLRRVAPTRHAMDDVILSLDGPQEKELHVKVAPSSLYTVGRHAWPCPARGGVPAVMRWGALDAGHMLAPQSDGKETTLTASTADLWSMLYTDADEFPLPDMYVERARRAGIEVTPVGGHARDEIAAHGARCRGLFLYRANVDEALLAALPHCRILARVGTGYDLIDVEAARRRGVMVTYVPDFCTEELSDQVMAFVLGFSRQFPFILHRAREHRWLRASEVPEMRRLSRQSLGLLGFGRSGQRTAEKARTFGLDVLVWTRTHRGEALARTGARAASFEDVLGCDYISLHLPLTDATRGLLGCEALAQVTPGAVLINVSRGAIVDTDALVAALQAGRLAGAALDVVHPAPLPPDHPLWSMPNVWLTSHSGAFSRDARDEALAVAFDDASRVRAGLAPLHPVPEHADDAPAPR
jgi:D-3-phosphoglycerate dehydrogenase